LPPTGIRSVHDQNSSSDLTHHGILDNWSQNLEHGIEQNFDHYFYGKFDYQQRQNRYLHGKHCIAWVLRRNLPDVSLS
jgi:hypothetical protein